MKFGVVTFRGSNCDQDMLHALCHDLGQEAVSLWHKDHDLQGVDMVILPGGFSYGDYLRSGAIARFSPIMADVIKHADKGGYVMGICNGFQMLTEAHFLPGALLHNSSHNFICKNIHLTPGMLDSAITADLDMTKAYKIPIAHGEGRYHADEDTLNRLDDNGQVLFYYCDEQAKDTDASNPNGSIDNIAGVCNARKNVMGMMPHPERAATEDLLNADGKILLESLLNHMTTA